MLSIASFFAVLGAAIDLNQSNPPPVIGLPGLDESWVHEDIFIHQRDEAVMNHSRRLQEEEGGWVLPYKLDRIPPPPLKYIPGSGAVIARVYIMYEVKTNDWHYMKKRLSNSLATFLGVSPLYVDLEQVVPVIVGERCVPGILTCRDVVRNVRLRAPGIGGAFVDGDLHNTDPRECGPTDASKAGGSIGDGVEALEASAFNPQWRDDADLLLKVWEDNFCVSQFNTSLMLFPTPINNTYITGWRYDSKRRSIGNLIVAGNQDRSVPLELHIVGVIPTKWARYFNTKFILNGSIPLPLYQPEVVDTTAVYTDDLNVTIGIFGVRQKEGGIRMGILDYLPVCLDPPVEARGCFRIDHKIYDDNVWNEYNFKNNILWQRNLVLAGLSEYNYPFGDWNATEGPWPSYEWYGFRMTPEDPGVRYLGPWAQYTFPQKEYSLDQQSFCQTGTNCSEIPVAPSPRYLHSAVLYYTWDFEQHAHKYLCDSRPECGEDCLGNLTCLGGVSYFQNNFYFRSSTFDSDDGGTIAPRNLAHLDCPRTCCMSRRLCLRLTDACGYRVPFSSPMMLIFGGKGFEHVKDPATNRLIYHFCEQLSKVDLREEWRSCSEVTLNELWRYDIKGNKWEFLKTDSATSPTTLEPVGWPVARFGHGAAVIEKVDDQNSDLKRIYMYIFGGMGNQCPGSVCHDVWRYEIPWAAQAYYPKYPTGDWVRGNVWDRLKDCPYGGRYRHGMVSTSSMEYIYVYGGQTLGGFDNTLLRYRVSTDLWEDMRPYGRVSLTRLMYDYFGTPSATTAPVQSYEEETDVDCDLAWSYTGKFAHCKVCPSCGLVLGRREEGAHMPSERADFSVVSFFDETPAAVDDALAVFGGFRTTWGYYATTPKECEASALTTTTTTTTTSAGGVITLTDPPATTPLPQGDGTTTLLEGGVQVVGSFDTLGNDQNPETSVGLITTTATTTQQVQLELGVTLTTTATHTTSTSTIITTTSGTTTTTKTMTSEEEETTTSAGPGTNPPVVSGSYASQSNATTGLSPSDTATGVVLREGPTPSCSPKYYFDDIWYYDTTVNQWSALQIFGSDPPPRKGHTMIARKARSNDTQVVLFGGNQQDDPLNDLWILHVKRVGVERTWTQIDKFFPGVRPPAVSFHTMVYVEELDTAYVFGGLHWKSTDRLETDRLRNIDRRCLKEAQGLPMTEHGSSEVAFLTKMVAKCAASGFCCILTAGLRSLGQAPGMWMSGMKIRTADYALNLTAISTLCRSDCEANAFFPEFYPIISEGVWTFNMSSCPNNCNGNGRCDFSQCVCEPPWYGADCSLRKCPGTVCYADSSTKEQFCLECSSHGRCINSRCLCDPGWSYSDCSVPLCEDNCSSTPLMQRGVCVEDFPVHQCHCFGRYSGYTCNELLCLNACSGRGVCVNGMCQCELGFHGDDCSIFMIEFENQNFGEFVDPTATDATAATTAATV
ncbi:unnamed protein product [Effrenium voratum]|nr:unnamed protein product [Effrenium voratum]|mmetsp:Transcript_33969/g.81508  ORF Transcript_33969/g.81508 Transcript_33969/m.81508 type:complete len:1448 (+) Transcript_33969:92-4435(+)